MSLAAADAIPPGSPWYVYAITSLVAFLVAYVAARSPVWVEKAKGRIAGKAAADPPAAVEKVNAGEAILREWRNATQKALDEAEQDNDELRERIARLEKELYARGWDGRLPR
ncbi:hypothetical protein NQK81_13260 [Amycolatopsis roodepoortensis]|uniref:hypothetical protein n=1 Tax=Amycolatopsis roodepoortensis TaxID=700274 RepID=UPI00214B2CB8|nr:hypothetical protein [Amycolatopsis roodepoortensis]UUV34373.1 hypothetical protein NQK81_13260 [Amycolatopsis roodepoortensis]